MHKLDLLDNGLRVATRPMDHMESVSIGIWIRAGSRYENQDNSGISHLLEHLLFKGTLRRDMKTIKEEIEGRGGSFNGFTTEEYTCYLVKLLAKDAELGVDILSDMVLNPKLDDGEIEKEKNVIVEEINMYKDIPAQHVHEILAEMLWPDQPLGMPLAGRIESVKSLTKADLVSYKDGYYNPKNMLLIGAGKIGEADLMGLSKKYLSKPRGKDVSRFEGASIGQTEPRLNINFKETEQTHVALGFHAIDRFHPDRYALSLMNVILGANMSSRLFHIVRDSLALCYEISSGIRRYEDAGALVVSAGVDDKKLVKALEVVLEVLRSMKSEPAPEEELRRAKEYYKGQLLFALEDTMSLMLWSGEKIIAGEKEFAVDKILERVERITQDDILRVSNTVFKDNFLNLAIIGPVRDDKEIKEAVRGEGLDKAF